MAGYTPLFDSLLTGTLYGRWPHTGIWACLLSRASREGVIDETPQCLASAIGVPVETLLQCVRDFMEPDPESRSKDDDGRRLTLIDPERSWGWRIVNHGKYREKARKRAYDETRTESGEDAERKRLQRAHNSVSRDVPTRPDASRDVPLSSPTPEAKTVREPPSASSQNGSSKTRKPEGKGTKIPIPPDLTLTDDMRQKALKRFPDCDPERMFEQFRAHHEAHGKAMKSWPAAWVTWIGNGERFGYPRRDRGEAGVGPNLLS